MSVKEGADLWLYDRQKWQGADANLMLMCSNVHLTIYIFKAVLQISEFTSARKAA